MLKIGLSCEINKDSFNSNLNGLLSFKGIEKLSKLALWPYSNVWSKTADFLGVLTNLPVKGAITNAHKLSQRNVFEFDHNKLRCSNYL